MTPNYKKRRALFAMLNDFSVPTSAVIREFGTELGWDYEKRDQFRNWVNGSPLFDSEKITDDQCAQFWDIATIHYWGLISPKKPKLEDHESKTTGIRNTNS